MNRRLRFSQFGDPGKVLALEEGVMPEPGPGQVRVRLTHRPINPSDLRTMSGEYGRLPSLPATPGLEGMGYVDALGKDVTGLALGQRVTGLGVAGTWQTYVLARPTQLLPVPDSVPDQTAAQLIGNPVTAWVMLTEELALQEGDWLLQTAAGSTLGRIVLQIARLKGYKTINLVRRREQVQELLDLGADVAISTEEPDVVEQVKQVTGGKGVKGVLEAVGGSTGSLAFRCLQAGGTMLAYGMLSGQPTPIHNGEMLFKGATMRGFWVTYWFRSTPPERVSAVLAELMRLMETGQIVPPVEAEYDLADFQTAIEHAQRPGNSGKVLLVG